MNIGKKSWLLIAAGATILIVLAFVLKSHLNVPELDMSNAATGREQINTIENWFEQLQKDRKFNGAVLIAKEGRPILMRAFGFTDYTENEQLTSQSSFRLASLTKQFTAMGIMILKHKGQLKYDDFISQYIPNFPYSNITIRQVLNMTSGIEDNYMDLAIEYQSDVGSVMSIKEAIGLIIKYPENQVKKPLERFEYSNTSYVLLAHLIEELSGSSFEDFMKNEIFLPLGMRNTRVWNLMSKDATFKNKTEGFINSNSDPIPLLPDFIDGVAGDGAIFSSIEDFLIWDQSWYSNKLLPIKEKQEAYKTPVLNDGSKSDYGFGWVVEDHAVRHSGSWLGARTFIHRNIQDRTLLVILDNGENKQLSEIVRQLQKHIDWDRI